MRDAALMVAITASGLFAGVMLALVVILNRMWAAMPPADSLQTMRAFIAAARRNPIITVLTLLPGLAPLPALLAGLDPWIIGGILLGWGPFLVTMTLNIPLYERIAAQNADVTTLRAHFARLNALRLGLALAAMGCYLAAL